MKHILALLGLLVAFGCLMATESSKEEDAAEELSGPELLKTVNEARKLVDEAYKISRESAKADLNKTHITPSDFVKHLKEPVAATRKAMRASSYMEASLDLLKKRLQEKWPRPFNISDVLDAKQKKTLALATGCDYPIRAITCPEDSPYRTITGECNNRQNPHWGMSNHAFARWLPAEYEDGFYLPRGLIEGQLYSGHPLPLVRRVSNEMVGTPNEDVTDDEGRALAFMHWGQWIDHDLDQAPFTTTTIDNKRVNCDRSCNYIPPCFPIKIPPEDPRIPSDMCIPFTRTAPVCNPTALVREQLNALTSFMDASMVYGSDEATAKILRNLTNDLGLMAVNEEFTDDGLALLPFEDNPQSVCIVTNRTANIPCFKAGDRRATENLGLTSIHTMFLREHNRLATELNQLNPHWEGDKVYQVTRKIIGAQIQIITYRDYLPLVLGSEMNNQLPLYQGYNESVDPTIANVFTLAFRYGHGSVPPFVPRLDENFQPSSAVPLHLTFCAPWRIVYEGGIEPIVRGFLADQPKLMRQNQVMVKELQDRLFEQTTGYGLDLASFNMQRGRDHGLPGYNAWRRFCDLSAPSNEADLAAVMNNTMLAKNFMDLYGTPENIDIWFGALAEPFVPYGRAGPLLTCLIGKQFRNIRDGDRFWWENPTVFTPQQRHALRSESFSRIICDNTRLEKVPNNVFKKNQYPNDFVNCDDITKLDLSAWKEVE